MLRSGGVLVKGPTVVWTGSPQTWGSFPASLELGNRWASYAEIYRQGTWIRIVIDKRANCLARLPLKVYQRDDRGRPEARDHPYAQLLRRPNELHSRFFFWLWTATTFDIYGEAFWGKVRDAGGRPVQLVPLHPTSMRITDETSDGRLVWEFQNDRVRIENIDPADLVHFRNYNPTDINRGLSKLESVRATLEHEDAAQRATSAFWKKGARPGVLLTTPGRLSDPAAARLRLQWDQVSGADNTGRTVVLEEGTKPERWALTAEEAQYIDGRKLNREEFVAVYDMPPPAVHILDRATFNNIVEQMRSVYRDTMPPVLNGFEADMEMQLRGSIAPGRTEPDFGDDVYAEFLLDEVLRGDFEARADAYQKSDFMTLAEKREKENLPYIEGTDRIFMNSATLPLESLGQLPPAADRSSPKTLSEHERRTVMGRLSRQKTLDEIDPDSLARGLNGAGEAVRSELEAAKDAGESVEDFRARLKEMTAKESPVLALARSVSELAAKPVPPPPAPVVNVAPPTVTVEAPPPPNIELHVSGGARIRRIERDESGNIAQIVEEE